MATTKYYTVNKINKGFITHTDREKSHLVFEIMGNVVKVTGNSTNIDKWATRNGVKKILTSQATAQKTQYILQGLQNKKTELQNELQDILNKIAQMGG